MLPYYSEYTSALRRLRVVSTAAPRRFRDDSLMATCWLSSQWSMQCSKGRDVALPDFGLQISNRWIFEQFFSFLRPYHGSLVAPPRLNYDSAMDSKLFIGGCSVALPLCVDSAAARRRLSDSSTFATRRCHVRSPVVLWRLSLTLETKRARSFWVPTIPSSIFLCLLPSSILLCLLL